MPEHKRETRLARLQRYLAQLTTFKALNRDAIPTNLRAKFGPTYTTDDLFSVVALPQKLTALPAAPFLVTAVTEALRASLRYRPITSLVAGEADEFCAQHARVFGSTIMTSDSDLLIHDVGHDGKVILLKDLQHDGSSLNALQFHPAKLAHDWDLGTLLPLAFAIKNHRRRSFNDFLTIARCQKMDDPEYARFVSEYITDPPVQAPLVVAVLASDTGYPASVWHNLDSRVSEFVHQTRSLWLQQEAQISEDTHVVEYDMYLGFLFDDSSRASAWNAGSQLRRLGYSLLCASSLKSARVVEYDRRGLLITPIGVSLLDGRDSMAACSIKITELLDKLLPILDHTPVEKWRFVGTYLVMKELKEDGRAVPAKSDARVLLLSGAHQGTWPSIHFSAILQAVLYSFRILQQLSRVFLALYSKNHAMVGLVELLTHLQLRLGTLPQVRDLFLPVMPSELDVEALQKSYEAVDKLFDMVGVQEDSAAAPSKKEGKKRKKNAQPTSTAAKSAQATKKASNMYAALADT